jgi:hypothetical protein
MVFFIVIPVIAIWVIAFPLLILMILYRNKSRFNEPDMLIKYGMFYIGLKDKHYYWELIVINIRKIIATAISISLNKEN